MIKINLLPFRAARKKENVKRQISVYVLTLLFLLTVMGYLFLSLNGTLSSLKAEQADKKKELATYDGINKRLSELKNEIEEIRSKLGVIRGLEKNKTGPVHLLDEIATAVPKDKLWLTSLQESNGTLTLQGTAMDNETVALFMTNLEKAQHIVSVDLKSTRLKNLAQHKLDVTDFVLACKIYSYKPEPPPENVKKAKGASQSRKKH
jgi:type IV pilus assembly protein PilN